ncbi:MAG: PAS domain S-box protein, partial [Bacteroidales bacterium]
MFIDIVQNIAILLAFAVLYDYVWLKYKHKKSLLLKIITGLTIGFIGVVLMKTPWVMAEGLIFDVRSVLLSVAGLFFGLTPTLIAITIAAVFRYWLGGPGMVMGIVVIILSGLIGLAWRNFIPDVFGRNRMWKILGMGMAVHIVMLAATVLLPSAVAFDTFKNIAPSVLTLYPLATVLLSTLLLEREKKLQREKLIEASEQRFRNLFESNQSVMLILDAQDEKILDANPSALKFYGYDYATLTGMYVQQLCANEKECPQTNIFTNITANNGIRLKHKLADGRIRQVEIYQSLIEYHSRKVIFAIIHDVTERLQAEQKLHNLYHIIENTLNELYIAAADTFFIIEANRGAMQNSGYSREELQRMTLVELMPSFKQDDFGKAINNLRNQNDIIVLETNFRKKNGQLYPVEMHLQKMQYGELPVIVVFVNDITQRKKFDQELIEARDRAEESERLKSSFLANLSHEIRTPLNSIIGFSNLLRKGNLLKEKIERYTSIIASSGNQIAEIINETIEIAEIDAGTVKIEMAPFNLNDCMKEVYNEMLGLVPQNSNIKLYIFNENLDEPFIILGDRSKIVKILSNLVSNAINYTLDGFVSFGYTVENGKLIFKVIDTGIGIEPQDIPRIFSRFYRAKNSLTIKKPGIGLGMAIVQAYVELLNGKIVV